MVDKRYALFVKHNNEWVRVSPWSIEGIKRAAFNFRNLINSLVLDKGLNAAIREAKEKDISEAAATENLKRILKGF